MPSLRYKVDGLIDDLYSISVLMAVEETGLKEEIFPNECPFSIKQLLDSNFYP
ncbi:DUF29 family protein [Fangia hongkongensis]|nr:DUF29 family protein [Fangia hongkongensis]